MITQLIDVTNITAPWTSAPIPTNISGPRATLYVMNVSNQTYFLDFGNGNQAHIPPYWARPFCLPSSIRWITFTIAKSPVGMPNPPFSHISIETYLLDEDTSHLTSTSINAQVSVQGQTSSQVTTAQTLQNDGNGAQNIIESTPSGAGGSTWVADNQGNLTIKGNNAGVLSQLLQLVAGASPAVTVGSSSVNVTIPGSLTINGTTFTAAIQCFATLTLINGSNQSTLQTDATGNLLITSTAGNVEITAPTGKNVQLGANGGVASILDGNATGSTWLKAGGTGNINFQIPNNNTVASLSSAGVMTAVGFSLSGTNGNTYSMYTNGISRISQFTGTGNGTYNHGLGITPSTTWMSINSSISTTTFSITSGTATQCTVLMNNSLAFQGTVLRF